MTLPQAFLDRPVTHRALHDRALGRVENSLASVLAAIDAGYGIEIDVQLSADDEAMVFHDDLLDRLTDEKGPVRDVDSQTLRTIRLTGDAGTIPTLADVLGVVNGRVPLLVEIKDQDGAMGPNVGPLERAVCTALTGYQGDVAVMSFNPHSMALCQTLAPAIPRGLTTSSYESMFWPQVPADRRYRLRDILDFDRVGASFISHEVSDLKHPRVRDLKDAGVPVLCWTVRSAEQEIAARKLADNITFEGYPA